MSSRFHGITRARGDRRDARFVSPAFAQRSDDPDAEMRIQQLENRLRQLTGQNEELQYRNRQLEERLRALQGGAQAAPGGPPPAGRLSPVSPRSRRQPKSAAAIGQPPAPAAGYGAADRSAGADRAGAARPPAGAGPAPWRCLRSQPESECAGRAAALWRRPVADSGRARRSALPADAGQASRSISASTVRPRTRGGALPPPRGVPASAGHAGDRCRRRRPRKGRVRPRHRLHAAQGLRARRRDHAQLRAEISRPIR